MDKIKLNSSDYLLIQLLDKNSRSTLRELSSKLQLSKTACSKKIAKLEKNNIVSYISVVDYYALGQQNIHIYFKLKKINSSELESKLNQISQIKEIVWLTKLFGQYDLGISILYYDLFTINDVVTKIYSILENLILEETKQLITSQVIQSFIYKGEGLVERDIVKLNFKSNPVKVSPAESKLINKISENSRFKYYKLAEYLNKDVKTVKKSLTRLRQEGVIRKYKLMIDYNKLGFTWYLCILNLKKSCDVSKLITHFSRFDCIPYLSKTLSGDLIFDFLSKNSSELILFLEKLSDDFEEVIDYKVLVITDIFKLTETNVDI